MESILYKRVSLLTCCCTFPLSAIELSCKIESIITEKPRIEWKKIKNGEPSYVYFEDEVSGKLSTAISILIVLPHLLGYLFWRELIEVLS